MSIPSKQVGKSPEYYILYEILKKLDQLIKVTSSGITTTTTTTIP